MRGLVLLALCNACEGAGGVSIFMIGQAIDLSPWPVLAMYIMVIIVSVFYELLTHHIDHVVTSRSGKAIVAHVYKEVMILGGISLLLTILENSGGDLLFEPVFYHYVHFVIFFMAINLIVSVSSLFLFINRSWSKWLFFESVIDGIEHDPRMSLAERHAVLNQFVKRSPDGKKMLACILFFRSNLPSVFRRVSFTRYMKKQQRKELLNFLHLNATAWASLALVMLMVAVQNYFIAKAVGPSSTSSSSSSSSSSDTVNTTDVNTTCICPDIVSSASGSGSDVTGSDEFDLTSIMLFIAVEGWGTMLFIFVCYLKVLHSYNRFANHIEDMSKRDNCDRAQPKRQDFYFWKGKPKMLMQFMQVMLLCQVFYLATITCNMGPRLFGLEPYGIFILIFSVIPCVLVFVLLIPRLMPKYTILTSVGDKIDMETLQRIQQSDDTDGRYRRIHHREHTASAPAEVLSETASPLDEYVEALMKEEQEVRAAASKHDQYTLLPDLEMVQKPKAGGHGEKRLPELICEECSSQLAQVSCGFCGMLCRQCDADYHRLKRNQGHTLITIKSGHNAVQGQSLLTDQPLLPTSVTAVKYGGDKKKGKQQQQQQQVSSQSQALLT